MSHARATSLLSAVFVVVAACIGAPAQDDDTADSPSPLPERSTTLHSVDRIEMLEATAPDGVKLRGRVYIPDGEGPFATVLVVGPYFDSGGSRTDMMDVEANGRRTMLHIYGPLIDAGFAVAFMSLRGSGMSEGCFQFGGPKDWPDLYAMVETVANGSWSNGNVGMIGISFEGWTQYMAAAAKPPSLKALVPQSAVIDYWSLVTRNGQPYGDTAKLQAEWTVKASTGTFGPTSVLVFLIGYSQTPLHAIPEPPHPSHFQCPEYVTDTPPNLQLAYIGDRGPYFDARDYRDEIANSTIPMFVSNGLTNGEGHILQFEGLWDILPDEKRMLLGQWGHDYPLNHKEDYAQQYVDWFDHYLRGGPKRVETGIVEYQDNTRAWHNATRWPPPGQDVRLYLSGDELVTDPADLQASTQSIVSVPKQDPRPQACAGDGAIQAAYVSPPVTEDVLLAGNFLVNFTLTSNMEDGNLGIFLYQTSSAACPYTQASEVRRALTDLRHWENTGFGRPFPTDTPTSMEVRSYPFAVKVSAGNRLSLLFGGATADLQPDPHLPRMQVTTSPSAPATLDLHVVQGTLGFGG